MITSRSVLLTLCILSAAFWVAAAPTTTTSTTSTAAPAAATPSTAPAAATTAPADKSLQENLEEILQGPSQGESYHYDSQGRRDPFRALIGGQRQRSGGPKPPGLPGFLVDEINVAGVIKTRDGFQAMMVGPDNKSYLVRVGDKLWDGEVIRITPTSVVFRQEVNDPTSIERFKEVVKELTPQSGKKTP